MLPEAPPSGAAPPAHAPAPPCAVLASVLKTWAPCVRRAGCIRLGGFMSVNSCFILLKRNVFLGSQSQLILILLTT